MSTGTRVSTHGGGGGGHIYASRGNRAPCPGCCRGTPGGFQAWGTECHRDVPHAGSRPACGAGRGLTGGGLKRRPLGHCSWLKTFPHASAEGTLACDLPRCTAHASLRKGPLASSRPLTKSEGHITD